LANIELFSSRSRNTEENHADRLLWEACQLLPIAACVSQNDLLIDANRAFKALFGFDISETGPIPLNRLGTRGNGPEPSTEPCALQDHAGRTKWCRIFRLYDEGIVIWLFESASKERALHEKVHRLENRVRNQVESKTVAVRRANVEYRQELEKMRVFDVGLTQSREKYRVLFQNSEAGILFVNDAGEISQINPAMQLLVGARNQIDFRKIADEPICSIHSQDARISLGELARHLVKDVIGEQEYLVAIRRPGKSEIWADVRCTRMHVKDFSAALTFRDCTSEILASRREAEQRHQLNRLGRISLAGHLGSAVAHELGQPLNACMSYLGGLEHIVGSEPEPASVRHGLSQIRKELCRASDVLKNMRQFVSHHSPVCQAVCIKQLVHHTEELLVPTMRDGGITMELAMSLDNGTMVEGNAVEIQQVLVNLAMNAFDALFEAKPAKPVVRVAVEKHPSEAIVCTVSDNGPGISPELLDQLFKPYHTTKNGGLGLGLPMCRNIIESHGGLIWAESDVEQGATFHFTLPISGIADTK